MLAQFVLWLRSLGMSEEAQGLVEYALIIVLIAIVVIAVLGLLGGQIETVFTNITTGLQGTAP
jgi:pilus assembly protein Flp/PilA